VQQQTYKSAYASANLTEKKAIIIEARAYLEATTTNNLFPYWYGTEWDFNGTTRTPQNGKIACGYFVTNIISDLGFAIPRVKWAQSASEVFIKKLAFGRVKRFHNATINDVETYLLHAGDGLYLAGLDMHTGFVLVAKDEVRFIHADYYEPDIGVVSEKLDDVGPMADSAYRVFGKLFSDEMVVCWLKGVNVE